MALSIGRPDRIRSPGWLMAIAAQLNGCNSRVNDCPPSGSVASPRSFY
ncbi:hypothetical protein IFO70_18370 [Phormidium tenue FACHB-886]|nr:hypothetical protein [Phormidium tenue FACHB-886]